MARIASISALACGAVLLGLGAARAQDAPDPSLVEKGRYLAAAGDCTSCHSDPATGSPFAGGYGLASPIGTIYGPNITPAKAGIGGWSLAQFSDAVRKGRGSKGYLYPGMPYASFSGISDADIKALYSYFMLGVPAVEHKAPETNLPFPFNFRILMMGWDLLFGSAGGKPASQSPESGVARGKYLVETLVHCGDCHTPRGLFMQSKTSLFLGGGQLGSWVAPNITSDPISGIGKWSEDEITRFLKTGALPGMAIAAGDMGLAVQNSFSHLSDSDVRAIAVYIKTVPPVAGSQTAPRSGWSKSTPQPVAQLEHPMDPRDHKAFITVGEMTGAQIYEGACATCHGHDGRGTPDRVLPSLVGSSAVGAADPSNLVMTITSGLNRKAGHVHAAMPAFGTQFTPLQVAKVADYVATSFGDPAHRVTEADVKRVYAASTKSNWLIGNAGLLTWLALVALAGAIGYWGLARRRRHATTQNN